MTGSNPRLSTAYGWSAQGELLTINYTDATPDVTCTYNAENGSIATKQDGTGTHTYTIRTDGLMESESIAMSGGGTALIDPGWDTYRRRKTLVSSLGGAATGLETRYYSTQGRLAYVSAEGRTTEFQYHTGTNRIAKRTSYMGADPNGTGANALVHVMESVETLDAQNRIWIMTNRRNNASGISVFSSHTYTFDALNRRETAAREDTTKWDYDYNDRSEVTGGKKLLNSGALLAGTASTYFYDEIGNRLTATSGGGPATGSGSPADVVRSVSYTPNALNQYAAITQDQRSFDVIGRYSTATASSPTVNSTVPYDQVVSSVTAGSVVTEQRQFRSSITAASSGNTAGNYENVNVQTSAGTVLEASGLKWVPGTTAVPQYDDDGNLTQNGRWTYTWDAENRLKSAIRAASTSPAVAQMKVEFTYDGLSRRTEKKVSTFVVSAWVETLRERTLYDGWNPIGTWRLQPADATHPAPWWKLHQHYVWGPDVSGTAQGAGGVGGLALIYDPGQPSGGWFLCYDGNGNITALVSATTNSPTAALYDYDAFGTPTRLSGPAAKLNPFRFSTKFTDDETELVYYGYRYYDPGMGRWLNRDPIGERGGQNLNSACGNKMIEMFDPFGLDAQATWENYIKESSKIRDEFGAIDAIKKDAYIRENGGLPKSPCEPPPSVPEDGQIIPPFYDLDIPGPRSHLIGADDDKDYSRGIQNRFPNLISRMKREAIYKINKTICEKKRRTTKITSDDYSWRPYIYVQEGSKPLKTDDSHWGDQTQPFGGMANLGSFWFRIQPSEIQLDCKICSSFGNKNCCQLLRRCRWKAIIELRDVAGLNPGDVWGLGKNLQWLAPGRRITRARYEISGQAVCCDIP